MQRFVNASQGPLSDVSHCMVSWQTAESARCGLGMFTVLAVIH